MKEQTLWKIAFVAHVVQLIICLAMAIGLLLGYRF